jgi:hypothetical protein
VTPVEFAALHLLTCGGVFLGAATARCSCGATNGDAPGPVRRRDRGRQASEEFPTECGQPPAVIVADAQSPGQDEPVGPAR